MVDAESPFAIGGAVQQRSWRTWLRALLAGFWIESTTTRAIRRKIVGGLPAKSRTAIGEIAFTSMMVLIASLYVNTAAVMI
jgi:hypothetical protein